MAIEDGMTLWGVEINDTLLHRLEKALTWAVIATVFFLPTSEALKNIFYVLSIAFYVCVIFVGRERIAVSPLGWLVLSFLGAAIMSASVSTYPWKAITGVWDIFRYTSFFFIVERGLREERHIRIALWAAVVSFGFSALVTILRYVYRGMTLGGYHHISAMSLGGIDYAALHSVMTLALIFGMYVHTDVDRWRSNLLLGIACLSVVVLGLTHVRMLWGGLIVVGLVLAWLRSARFAVAGLAVSILIVLGLSLVNLSVRQQVISLGNVETIANLGEQGRRKQFWVKAIRVWQGAPLFGIGPKTFSLYDDIKHNPERKKLASLSLPGSAHNLYLQTAAEMGAVGLVVLVATFAYIGVWLFRSRGAFASSWPAAVWDGAFGGWLAIVIHGLTYPSFGREHAMLFFMLLGLVQARLMMEKKSAVVAEGRKA